MPLRQSQSRPGRGVEQPLVLALVDGAESDGTVGLLDDGATPAQILASSGGSQPPFTQTQSEPGRSDVQVVGVLGAGDGAGVGAGAGEGCDGATMPGGSQPPL